MYGNVLCARVWSYLLWEVVVVKSLGRFLLRASESLRL